MKANTILDTIGNTPLLRLNRLRVRSGVPGAYVNQVAAAGVTLVTAAL